MRDDTLLTQAGRHPFDHDGVVNPPVYHASTVLYPDLATLEAGGKGMRVTYGRHGTPTTFALEEALTALEGGAGTVLAPSGLAAVGLALQALLRPGDHLLVSDSVYVPTRNLCERLLAAWGVEVAYYDPCIGAGIEPLLRDNTALVFAESPGSQTFEVQDLPALCQAAHSRGARVVVDNTWGAGYFHKPLALGADVSIQALTKYVVGHADAMLGAVLGTGDTYPGLRRHARLTGNSVGPDDVYLALRGLRSLGARLTRHQDSGLTVARWLQQRPEVLRVMHPGLPEDPGHRLWRRDFSGACGLFGCVLRPVPRAALAALLDGLQVFAMGYSWGGYESLLIPTWPERQRSATAWEPGGQTLRVHVGLEDPVDLIADLEAGFARLKAAA